MSIVKRHRLLTLFTGLVLVGMLAIAAFGVYLADATGSLPWQTDPTRIAITPFAGIDFSNPSAPVTPTVAVTPSP
jgi:hypothetical protein